MSRKQCHRRPITPQPPRGLRPRLDAGQVLNLQLVHVANLDSIATGQASPELVWHWVGQVLTWSRVAELMGRGQAEMVQQMEMAERLIRRFVRTGRVLFDGPDYQTAKAGLPVMDELAATVDQATALAAAAWSEHHVTQVIERVRAEAPGHSEGSYAAMRASEEEQARWAV